MANKFTKAHNEVVAVLKDQAVTAPSGWLLILFETLILPILPQLLLLLAPKISGNPKLISVLKAVDQVLDTIIGEP